MMTMMLTPIRVHGMCDFDRDVVTAAAGPLRGASIATVQVNITLKCNLACHHCHVESSPKRDEEMTWETMHLVLDAARRANAKTIDITGGAPEMHPHFRRFVEAARQLDLDVMVRTNLTILLDEGFEDLPQFFRDHRVHLVASCARHVDTTTDFSDVQRPGLTLSKNGEYFGSLHTSG
jgi:radical SAM/Cys-rich protein